MPPPPEAERERRTTREKLRERLREGKLDERLVELDVKDRGRRRSRSPPTPASKRWASTSRTCCPPCSARRSRRRKMRVAEALDYLVQEEEQKLIDMDQVTRIALERVESSGIIFLDEIDKIAGREARPWSRRQPRRRAARHSAHRRRHHRQHALRLRAHRSHPVHRGRRVPRLQAERSDSGAAGTVSRSAWS